jgi:hypothetical protein
MPPASDTLGDVAKIVGGAGAVGGAILGLGKLWQGHSQRKREEAKRAREEAERERLKAEVQTGLIHALGTGAGFVFSLINAWDVAGPAGVLAVLDAVATAPPRPGDPTPAPG